MAVSCPEVMYGAYYPYLYGRGAARSFHHAPHFQYDRLNVQSGAGAGNAGSEAYGAGSAAGAGAAGGAAAGLSSGSASSGAGSPPHHHHQPRLRTKQEDHSRASNDGGGSSESEGECGAGGAGVACGTGAGARRAQYVSANCVVFTHYSGDVAAVVDDHFSRALAQDKHKESVPMVSRNLPASFFNAAACGGGGGMELYEYDPWHGHYAGYGGAHARHAAEYHAAAAASHHSMAAGYGGLLLPRTLHHQYKPVEWGHHQHVSSHLDPAACAPYSYPPVAGLEAQVQDTSKDLYWF